MYTYVSFYCSKTKTKSCRFAVRTHIENSVMMEKLFLINYVTSVGTSNSSCLQIQSHSFPRFPQSHPSQHPYILYPCSNPLRLNKLDLNTDKMGGEGQSQFGKDY